MTQAPAPVTDLIDMGLQQMPRELAIIKIENDSMMAMAALKPRDYAVVLADLKSQLENFKSFAQQAMYAKPVGKDRDTGKMKYARGLSIRAAEAIRCSMGHNKIRCSVTIIDADTVKIEATFTDFASGSIWQDETFVSKNYTSYQGKTLRHKDDRFADVVVKAAKSKCVREVILRSMPPGLRSELELLADKQIESFLDDSTVQKLVASFSTKNVTVEMLENHLGKKIDVLVTEDRKILAGIWTALEQEETTVAQTFGEDEKPAPATKPGTKTEELAKELAPEPAKKVEPEPTESKAKAVTQPQLRSAIEAKWNVVHGDCQETSKKWLDDHGMSGIGDVVNVVSVKQLQALLDSFA